MLLLNYTIKNKSFTWNMQDIYCISLSLIIYYFLQVAIRSSAQAGPLAALVLVAASAALAVSLSRIHYGQLSRLVRILIRGLGVIVLILTLSDSPFEAAWPLVDGFPRSTLFFRLGAPISILCLVLSIWRPAFQLPVLIYYDLSRRVFARVTSVDLVTTDYLNLVQITEFAVIGSFVVLYFFASTNKSGPAKKNGFGFAWPWLMHLGPLSGGPSRQNSMELIWSIAIGAHLSKYFWSGIIKLKMDWSPWTWVFHNETYLGVLLGLERGSPLLSSPFATQAFYSTFVYFVIIANIFVITAQLLSPFSVIRVRYLLILAMFFEVFHIAVFFTIAALFWTWIGFNMIVVMCCSRLREEEFTPAMKTAAFVSVFLAPLFFDIPRLGWLDTRSVVSEYFTVETADGRTAQVPTAYFMTPSSYTAGHAAMFVPPGHFAWTISGTQSTLHNMREANACALPKVDSEQNIGPNLSAIAMLVKNTHVFMTTYPFMKNAGLFYLLPHHMFSDPFYYREFNHISVRDIVRYRYVVDSVCLSLKDGVLARDVQKRSEYPIDVQH